VPLAPEVVAPPAPATIHVPKAVEASATPSSSVIEPKSAASAPEVVATEIAEPGPPKRFVLTPVGAVVAPSTTPAPSDALAPASTNQMHTELAAIKDLVGEVLQRQVVTGRNGAKMPQQLFDMYLHLLSQELAEELAEEVIEGLRRDLNDDDLLCDEVIHRRVLEKLEAYVPVSAEPLPERSTDGRPLTVALIGPTGVGKTTTLAKIAATCKLKKGMSVGLITADTYRIAAVDQLRTYANIIGLPLKIALTPAEMRHAVHSLGDCDLILIDTAGRSQNDGGKLAELQQFLHAADPHEVHLVLSSTASEKVLLNEAEAFGSIGVDKVVLTKLDEAVSFGVLINVMRRIGTELSFVTTGQEVPDHIEPGRADRLAELVVGGVLSR
jgi:flagellar biosynthesis protein FlhF